MLLRVVADGPKAQYSATPACAADARLPVLNWRDGSDLVVRRVTGQDRRRRVLAALVLGLALLSVAAHAAAARRVTIAVLDDGVTERDYVPLHLIEREARAILGREFDLRFPPELQVHGDWQAETIRARLQRLLSDPRTDVVLAAGLIATHTAARVPDLARPVIGLSVADVELQKLPRQGDASGKHNFVYLAGDHTVGADLEQFHRLVGFRELVVPTDRAMLEALPDLPRLAERAEQRLGIAITMLPVADSAADLLGRLPANADAVYVPPLTRFARSEIETLARGLIERRLPAYALLGTPYVEAGLLMTGAGRDVDRTRAARRVALNLQAILLGADAGTLKVALEQPRKLAINMATARAIGYSPRWQDLEGAIVLNARADSAVATTTLIDALALALDDNLALQVARYAPDIAAAEARVARAALLPRLGMGAGTTVIDRDRANPQIQPQRSGELSLEASQVVYSERAWAGYDIARALREAEDHALRIAVLDTLQQTAGAYLNLLSAQSQAAVRASNVQLTESNLELALSRERIGQSGRADVLRFQSELAIDRRNHYAALAEVDVARVELGRLLNLAPGSPLRVGDNGIPGLIELLADARYQRFFDNPASWRVYRSYAVERALANAPELDRIDAVGAGVERSLLAAERAYYVPDVTVVGQAATRVLRGGRGASLAATGLDEDEWALGMQATLPLFAGGERRAARDQARYELLRTGSERERLANDVSARVLAALERAGGSYPAIRLAREAARAARDNLDLVTDAYSVGAGSITELNDAQDAALTASLAEAQARYQFMIDFVGVLRGVGDFDVLLLPDGFDTWYEDIDAYYRAAQAQP